MKRDFGYTFPLVRTKKYFPHNFGVVNNADLNKRISFFDQRSNFFSFIDLRTIKVKRVLMSVECWLAYKNVRLCQLLRAFVAVASSKTLRWTKFHFFRVSFRFTRFSNRITNSVSSSVFRNIFFLQLIIIQISPEQTFSIVPVIFFPSIAFQNHSFR
jgi:hypothetical protein